MAGFTAVGAIAWVIFWGGLSGAALLTTVPRAPTRVPLHNELTAQCRDRAPALGEVKWFNAQRGYGFIKQVDGPDLFVHILDIERSGMEAPVFGQRVGFEIATDDRGKSRAANICS